MNHDAEDKEHLRKSIEILGGVTDAGVDEAWAFLRSPAGEIWVKALKNMLLNEGPKSDLQHFNAVRRFFDLPGFRYVARSMGEELQEGFKEKQS